MGDLIDRQAAIDAIEQAKERYFDRRVIIGKMQDIVNNLPSAQPERKKGRWILKSSASYMCECSECKAENFYAYVFDYEKNGYKQQDYYCPKCGADMRGEG